LLFTNADLEYSILKFIPIRAQFADLGQNWYLDISNALVTTMLISAFIPYIEVVIAIMIKTILRMLDSGCFMCRSGRAVLRTKKKTQ